MKLFSNSIPVRFVSILFAAFFLCCGSLTAADSFAQNPIVQFLDAQNALEDANSIEQLEEKFNAITPVDCELNEVKFTKDEVTFIILVYKLEVTALFRQMKKTGIYLDELESFLKDRKLDLEDLSKRFESATSIEIDFQEMLTYDTLYSYAFTMRITDDQITEIQNIIQTKEKGSQIYYKFKELLGIAYEKTMRQELAIKPFEEAYEFFKTDSPADALFCAENLRACYLAAGKMDQAEKYKKITEELNEDLGLDLVKANQLVMDIFNIYASNTFTSATKRNFLDLKKEILEYETSDIQTFILYTVSALVEYENLKFFSQETVLADVEKAFLVYDLFGDKDTDNPIFQLLMEELLDIKDKMLQMFAESRQFDKLNYWMAKMERKTQRDSFLQSSFESLNVEDASFLATNFSKFEDANQIILLEESKSPEERDKKMLLRAREIKKELEEEFDELTTKLSTKDAETFQSILSDKFVIDPSLLGQLSSVLPDDVAYIQYILLDDSILTYVAFRNAPPFSSVTPLSSLKESQRSFKKRLVRIRTILQDPDQNESIQKEMQWLYNTLFSKLKKQFVLKGIKKIVVNSSGLLRYIPFAALYDGKHYLIENYQVTTITGMDMIRIAKETKPKDASSLSISVFADPDGTLDSARKEAEMISGLFEKKNVYVGDKASINEFQSLVGNMNFVHLATHAVLNSTKPSESYILFANGEKWYYSDMVGFNIRDVDSFTLSGCSTAMTEKSTGGEIEGMAYQLLRKSPSGSVLASLWNVDDAATCTLMCDYYQNIMDSARKNHSLDRGGALRNAQLSLLHDPKTAAPYYWAAFTLFGDFR